MDNPVASKVADAGSSPARPVSKPCETCDNLIVLRYTPGMKPWHELALEHNTRFCPDCIAKRRAAQNKKNGKRQANAWKGVYRKPVRRAAPDDPLKNIDHHIARGSRLYWRDWRKAEERINRRQSK